MSMLCVLMAFSSPALRASTCKVTLQASDLLGQKIESRWLSLLLTDYRLQQYIAVLQDANGTFIIEEGIYRIRIAASGAVEYQALVGFLDCKSRPNQVLHVGLEFSGEKLSDRRTVVFHSKAPRLGKDITITMTSVFGATSLLTTYQSHTEARVYHVPLGAYWIILNSPSSNPEIFRFDLSGEDRGEVLLKNVLRLTWHTELERESPTRADN